MEENKTQTPEWVEAARKWQEENSEARSLFIIANDRDKIINVLDGATLLLIGSIYQSLKQNPKIAQHIEDAQTIAKGGIAEHLFQEKFKEYAEEHGIKVEECNPLDMKLKDLLGLDRANLFGKDDE